MTKYEGKNISKAVFVVEESYFLIAFDRVRSLLFWRRLGICEYSISELPLAFSWTCFEDHTVCADDWNVESGTDATTVPASNLKMN